MVAATAAFVLPTVATAQTSTPDSPAAAGATAQAAQLHQEVAGGTLLSDHGTKRVCAHCESVVVTEAKGSSKPLSTAAPSGYGPADLASAYKITSSSTSTATIAIIDAGVDGNLASDLATYRKTYGLPACTTASGCLKLVNYTGGAQPAPQKSGQGAQAEEQIAVETALDVDMASAACPSCHITEISVPWADGVNDGNTSMNDFSKAVSTAVSGGAKTVSISYGYTPTAQSTSGTDLADFNHPGVAIEVSTGDSGFNGGTHTSWPSDLPYAVGVGGTQLTKSGSTWSEKAWGVDSGNGAAGSGCETYFKAANGQPAAVTKACNNHLATASVSADASPATPLAIYDTYAPSSHQPPTGPSSVAPAPPRPTSRACSRGPVSRRACSARTPCTRPLRPTSATSPRATTRCRTSAQLRGRERVRVQRGQGLGRSDRSRFAAGPRRLLIH